MSNSRTEELKLFVDRQKRSEQIRDSGDPGLIARIAPTALESISFIGYDARRVKMVPR